MKPSTFNPLLSACALIIGCSSVGEDRAALPAETCTDGARKCEGLELLVCVEGAFGPDQSCSRTCDPEGGCDVDPVDICKVPGDELDGFSDCDESAPALSFSPDVQWTWSGVGADTQSIVTPLVANLTDDDGSGGIDLCDIPDVVVVAGPELFGFGHIYVLDGATGVLHFMVPTAVDVTVTPALGDIDGDGVSEIVTIANGRLVAFEHDGTAKWVDGAQVLAPYSIAIALADLDADGDVEIIAANTVADSDGSLLWAAPQQPGSWSATTAADLDGDGLLEVVLGNAAYHHDGSQYYLNAAVEPGYPAVANLDSYPEPEVLLTNRNGITVLEADGTTKFQDLRPTGDPPSHTTWIRPATIHDFDGDGLAEFALSSALTYAVYSASGDIKWQASVSDSSGIAAGTAFDFLGDGTAEAMYADETTMFIFGEGGTPLLSMPRTSGTLSEYPVVADIDNDGSAEIVVVSNVFGAGSSPTVQVIRDADDRWIQARRIWNQHTYHVTNVREDGTIPQNEVPSWTALNTFRTNAQLSGGAVCEPPIVQ